VTEATTSRNLAALFRNRLSQDVAQTSWRVPRKTGGSTSLATIMRFYLLAAAGPVCNRVECRLQRVKRHFTSHRLRLVVASVTPGQLVADGLLDRRGIGDGAVYTLNPRA